MSAEEGAVTGMQRLEEAEELLETGQIDAARDLFQQAAEDPKTQVPALVGLGRVALLGADWKQAHEWLAQAHRLDPRDAEALTWQGFLHEREGDRGKALECYRQAVELNADDPATRLCYGRALLEEGKATHAEVQLQAAVHLRPGEPLGYYLLGCVFLNGGRRSDAALRFARAIEVDADFSDAYDALGSLLLELGRADEGRKVLRAGLGRLREEDAQDCLRALVRAAVNPEDFESAMGSLGSRLPDSAEHQRLCIELGRRALEVGKLEQAAKIVAMLVERCPDLAEGHLELGMLHQHHGRSREAIASYRGAQSLDRHSWEAACRLGRMLLEETPDKDVEEGLRLLKLATDLAENDPRPNWELAQGYLKVGRNDRARRAALKVARSTEAPEAMVEQARDLLRRLPVR